MARALDYMRQLLDVPVRMDGVEASLSLMKNKRPQINPYLLDATEGKNAY